MKPLFVACSILLTLDSVGVSNALRISTFAKGPYSQVIAPLYANDSDDVIRKKIKLASATATIDPSVVLPYWPAHN